MGITEAEFADRRRRLAGECKSRGASGCVLFDSSYVRYYTGWVYLATERPVALIVDGTGEFTLFVPEFEVEHAQLKTTARRIESYPEYPGRRHPLLILSDVLAKSGIRRTIAADQDGYPGILGYAGPSLSEATGSDVVIMADFVEAAMSIKSPAEVDCIRESARWCNYAHRLLQRYSRPGATEAEASLRASGEATLAMLDTLGETIGGIQSSTDGATAGYRGQIGRHSSLAHAVAGNHPFRPGDVLVSETSAPVWGYKAELERTMIIGRPTPEQERLFAHMRAAQQTAIEAMRPGVTCAEVDSKVLGYFEDNDLMGVWGQHTGHAIGLRNHEAPFLDVGDETVIKPGMVFTVEPGIYVKGMAGYRNSDTVVVTEDGIDVLTYYPRDIEDLVIEI